MKLQSRWKRAQSGRPLTPRRSIDVLAAVYLALLWALSGIALHKGLLLFGAGAAVLAFGVFRAGRGSRRVLFGAFYLVLLGATGVLGAEAVLWLFPGVLHGRVANYTFSGYHQDPGGVFRPHSRLGREMIPGFRRAMYWNGHWWTHETNEDGYRGPALPAADAVFLGDSLIYGHGVEAEETLPAQFAAVSGRSAANLGQQGIGPIQSLLLFREKGARLRPRLVYVCLHPGDAQDALDVYEEATLEQFLSETRSAPLLVRPELRRERPRDASAWWSEHAAPRLRVARVLSALRGKPDWMLRAPAPAVEGAAYIPPLAEREAAYPAAEPGRPNELGLAWRANRRALVELGLLAESEGARVIVFDLGYPRAFSEAVEKLAAELRFRYDPAGRVVLQRALAGEPMYLANDGHWTAAGCRAMAQALATHAR